MRKLHIVFTTRQFFPCIGGTETYLYETARRLVLAGHRVTVITLNRNIWNGEKLTPESSVENIRILRVPYINLGLRPLPLINPIKIFSLLSSADIIHNHDIRFLFESCLAARILSGVPLIIGSHGFILHQKKLHWLKRLVFDWYYKPLFRLVDKLHVVSLQDLEKVQSCLPSDRLCLIPGGVDAKRFENTFRKPVAQSLFYFGRVDTHKGLDLLFAVLSRMQPRPTLRIAYASSRQECETALRQLAQKLGIENRVEWLGRLSDWQIAEELGKASLVVFPSRYEGFGLTTVEAMAAGAVVAANTIDAFKNLILEGKNGFLLPFENPTESAKKLEQLLALDASALQTISENAKQSARLQDWSVRSAAMLDLYAQVTKTPEPDLRAVYE